MEKEKFEICSYQDQEEEWIPKVRIETGGEPVVLDMAGEFSYKEKNEADNHARYLARHYLAGNR